MLKQKCVLEIDGRQLHTFIIGELVKDEPCIVLLHGGLDCLATWKDFPLDVAKKTGLPVVAYERYGHGQSGILPSEIRDIGYRHYEAEVVLPAVLATLKLNQVILVGHSDGGAIGLLGAAHLSKMVLGVCAISPPLVAEPLVREGIKHAVEQYEHGQLAKKLSVFHGNATEGLFYSWSNTWLSSRFNAWSCESALRKISCPVSLVFGGSDEYGYEPSLNLLYGELPSKPKVAILDGIGHMSHHYARKETVQTIHQLCVYVCH